MTEDSRRVPGIEMQQWMTDEGIRSLTQRIDATERELTELRTQHAAQMAAAKAALDAAIAEIEHLRGLLPPDARTSQ